ncbi:MAG: hypothetical protein KJZ78_08340 [Bryobacteraceae bacterium]|nr:hypothetical protein [Bryobacteraceae bacterium]
MSTAGSHGGRRGGAGRPRGVETKVVRLPAPLADFAKRLADGGILAGGIDTFFDIEARTATSVPLIGPTALSADDYVVRLLDFNELLVTHPAKIFAVHVTDYSMVGAGIYPGDIAVVNRAVAPSHDCIVLAWLNGEFTIKRYLIKSGAIVLHAENPNIRDVVIRKGFRFEVWGVITSSIRRF